MCRHLRYACWLYLHFLILTTIYKIVWAYCHAWRCQQPTRQPLISSHNCQHIASSCLSPCPDTPCDPQASPYGQTRPFRPWNTKEMRAERKENTNLVVLTYSGDFGLNQPKIAVGNGCKWSKCHDPNDLPTCSLSPQLLSLISTQMAQISTYAYFKTTLPLPLAFWHDGTDFRANTIRPSCVSTPHHSSITLWANTVTSNISARQ